MKRKIAASALALALAGCGGPDFMVVVDGSPEEVEAALAAMDTDSFASAYGVTPATLSRPGPGELLFTIPGFESLGDGKLHFTIESEIAGTSRIKVDIEVPPAPAFVDGEQMVISEDKIEKLFEEEMRAWARARSQGASGSAEIAEMANSIGVIAVSLQRSDQLGELASGAFGGGFDFAESDGFAGDFGGFGESSEDASPMSDPDADAADYGEPTADSYAYEESYDENFGEGYGDSDWGSDS